MSLSPVLNHLALDIIVLGSIVASSTARPAIEANRVHEQRTHRPSPLVRATDNIDDETREPINAPMDVEAPRAELLVSIDVPKCVRAPDLVDTSLDDARPSAYMSAN